MRRVRSRDTTPELALRRALWKQGLRYRIYSRQLPGNPDIVFRGARVVVFVDGDFWHGNQWRLRGLASLEDQFRHAKRADYWVPKIRRNMVRDADATARLEYGGWKVLRLWESDIAADLGGCVKRVRDAVEAGQQR
jgi:DNA mismatch endonuclease (patch repair protein)